jgi:hypothetical protein
MSPHGYSAVESYDPRRALRFREPDLILQPTVSNSRCDVHIISVRRYAKVIK